MHKISRFQIYLVIFAALILQVGAINRTEIFGTKPDLMLIVVVFLGLFFGAGTGLESGLAAGILKDIFAFDFFFANTLTLGVTGLIAGLISSKFFKESKKAEFLLVASFTVLSMSFHFMLTFFMPGSIAIRYSEFLFSAIIPACLYTGLASVPLYAIFIKIFNLKEADDYL